MGRLTDTILETGLKYRYKVKNILVPFADLDYQGWRLNNRLPRKAFKMLVDMEQVPAGAVLVAWFLSLSQNAIILRVSHKSYERVNRWSVIPDRVIRLVVM